jgi:hypothetical protein
MSLGEVQHVRVLENKTAPMSDVKKMGMQQAWMRASSTQWPQCTWTMAIVARVERRRVFWKLGAVDEESNGFPRVLRSSAGLVTERRTRQKREIFALPCIALPLTRQGREV